MRHKAVVIFVLSLAIGVFLIGFIWACSSYMNSVIKKDEPKVVDNSYAALYGTVVVATPIGFYKLK